MSQVQIVSKLMFLVLTGVFITNLKYTHQMTQSVNPTKKETSPSNISQNTTTVLWSPFGRRHKFWQNDKKCEKYTTRFAAAHNLRVRALVSYPGSGNTWVRYLIEAASGVYTGSVYRDPSIERAGHWGEGRDFRDGSTLVQKTHHSSVFDKRGQDNEWRRRHVREFHGRAVVVVRDPYFAIIAYWNYWSTLSHTETDCQESFKTAEFSQFVMIGISRWTEINQDWLSLGQEIHLIFYENLRDEPVEEIRKLLIYLNIPVNEGRLDCIRRHS